MPRLSLRRDRLRQLRRAFNEIALKRLFINSSSDEDGYGSDDSDEDLQLAILEEHEVLSARRYVGREKYRKSEYSVFHDHLKKDKEDHSGSGSSGSPSGSSGRDSASGSSERPWLSPTEFKEHYRVDRKTFHKLVDLIKEHEVFKKRRKGREQAPVSHQLLVLLRFLGTEGTAASNKDLRDVFKIGRGTCELYRKRCVTALRSLKSQTVTWPDAEERKEIAERIRKEYGWPNCVGLIDGTLFPLAFQPQRVDFSDYHGRKHAYSLSTLIVCDDRRLIRYYNAGWAGCSHDNRIFRNSWIYQDAASQFSFKEYMLGDCAFEATWFMVPAYKKPAGRVLEREQKLFNEEIGPPRVISEHCNGILKGRWQWLRSIRCKLTENRQSMRTILEYIDCCVILHNLVLDRGDEPLDEWLVDADETSSVGSHGSSDVTHESLRDLIDLPIAAAAPGGERRSRLCTYMFERGRFRGRHRNRPTETNRYI